MAFLHSIKISFQKDFFFKKFFPTSNNLSSKIPGVSTSFQKYFNRYTFLNKSIQMKNKTEKISISKNFYNSEMDDLSIIII